MLLAGCTSTTWYNANVTPEQARRDSYECQRDAANLVGMNTYNALAAVSLGQDCLRSKGYERVKTSELPPGVTK